MPDLKPPASLSALRLLFPFLRPYRGRVALASVVLVLASGLVVAAATELRRVAATPFGETPVFTMGVYAIGALAGDAAAFALGWPPEDGATLSPLQVDAAWTVLLAGLGAARWMLRDRRQHVLFDWLWLLVVLDQVAGFGLGRSPPVMAVAAAGVATALLAALLRRSRLASSVP